MKRLTSALGRRSDGRQRIVFGICVALTTFSALAVVVSAHDSRSLFRQLQEYRREARELEVDWKRLLLEESAWQDHARVEQIARDELSMTTPRDRDILVMRLPR